MNLNKLALVAAIATASITGSPARAATVIDFEDLPLGAPANGASTVSGDFGFFSSDQGVFNSPPKSSNGTNELVYSGSYGGLEIYTYADPFSVSSLDAGLSYYTNATSFKVTALGNLADGSTVTDTFTVSDGLKHFSFADLNNLTMLTLSGPLDGYIAIDNIAIGATGAVPEPGAWAMMILGLGLVGTVMRTGKPVSV